MVTNKHTKVLLYSKNLPDRDERLCVERNADKTFTVSVDYQGMVRTSAKQKDVAVNAMAEMLEPYIEPQRIRRVFASLPEGTMVRRFVVDKNGDRRTCCGGCVMVYSGPVRPFSWTFFVRMDGLSETAPTAEEALSKLRHFVFAAQTDNDFLHEFIHGIVELENTCKQGLVD